MSPRDQIVPAQPQDTNALSHVIARSFLTLAPSIWLIPGEDDRRRIFPGYFRLYVQEAMERGHVYTTVDRTAVALWLPVGEEGEALAADYDEALARVTERWVDRFRTFDGLLAKHHPTGLRHDHLAILAVDPDQQRRGIGTELLTAHHRRLEQTPEPVAAYLEASDAGTRELYVRHGYTDLGDPIQLPVGPQMFPMLRRPASADEQRA
ncbi:GNAT family N-acetyltransferase [Catenulispora yoronensis]|uniref:GNAT family N-acetyltransferase n=1 Tax=Catenulispora yoronensis TaxID=450799 RepID=A0ABP5FPF5_9ACTN